MKKFITGILICIMLVSIFPISGLATSVPGKPSINSFTAVSTSSIKISWGSVSGATKYRVDRRKSTETNYKTLTTSCTSRTYTDKGLVAGSLYYYRVYAINSAGTSKRSETYAAYTKPSTPGTPTVTIGGQSQMIISWNKVSGATHYKLLCRVGSDSTYEVVANNLTGTSYTHKGLSAGTRHCYKVVAIVKASLGEEGKRKTVSVESERSAMASKYTTAIRPSNTVDNNNPTHTILEWKAAKGQSSGYTYEIWRNGKRIATTTSTKYIDKTGISGTVYEYEIKIDGSSWTTNKFYAGPKMTNKTVVTPESATSIRISWNKPNGGSGLVYRVKRWNGTEYIDLANTSNTYYVDSGLKTGEFYKYYIQVRDKDGNYITSNINGSTTLQILPTKITLNKSAATLNEGDILSLSATITPSNSTSKSISWSSSNSNIAAISSNGVITAKSDGSAVITARTANGLTASCTITVQPKVCIHEYGDWITVKNATCVEDGNRYRVCTICGEGKETEVIPASGHNFSEEWTIIKRPTCTEEGEQVHICTRCDVTSDSTVLFALGHSFTDDWITEKAATCTENGTECELCSVCGECQTREIEPLGHEYEQISDTPPTETQAGTRVYKCTRCNDSYSESYVEAVEGGKVTVGVVDASAGSEIEIPVTISENPGISGFKLVINYDKSVMTPKSITKGDILDSGIFQSNLNEGRPADELEHVQVTWSNVRNMVENGAIFNVVFEINENSAYGNSLISINAETSSLTDSSGRYIIPVFTAGTVNIDEVRKGDIYIDGNIDTNDSSLLAKHLAHYRNISLTDRQLDAADIFEDGNVNTKDGVSLSQILAGWTTPEVQLSSVGGNITIKAGKAEGSSGEYVDIPIIAEGNTGIAGFELQINYDKEYLTPVSMSDGAVLKEVEATAGSNGVESNIREENISVDDLDYVTAYWNNPGDMKENGELFTVRFLINKSEATDINVPVGISYDAGDLCNAALDDIVANIVPGEVQIIGESGSTDDPGDDVQETEMQYDITNIMMKSETGEEYDTIPDYGGFYLNISINGRTDNYIPAQVIAAAYDADGALMALSTDDIYTSGTSVLYVGETKKEIDDIKIFVWDSINGMMPLGDAVCHNKNILEF